MENIRPIRSDDDLAWALKEIEVYFDREPAPGSADDDRFAVLAALIAAYEAENYPIEPMDPVDMIATYLQEHQLTSADLGRVIGSRSRASEILNRQRALNLPMINKIADAWHLPLADLARAYALNLPKRAA